MDIIQIDAGVILELIVIVQLAALIYYAHRIATALEKK